MPRLNFEQVKDKWIGLRTLIGDRTGFRFSFERPGESFG
jgi:hypothetical protein